MSKLIKIDKEYKQWISELSERFRISQLRASVKVNSEMLRFYWLLGKDIVELKAESKWGDKILQNISLDLQDKLPGVKGMSETNIDYMKRFYILYSQLNVISPQVVGKITNQFPHNLWTIYFLFPGDTTDLLLTSVMITLKKPISMFKNNSKQLVALCIVEFSRYGLIRTSRKSYFQL